MGLSNAFKKKSPQWHDIGQIFFFTVIALIYPPAKGKKNRISSPSFKGAADWFN
jgi:hypothetical protein